MRRMKMKKNDDKVTITTTDNFFIVCDDNDVNITSYETIWVIDSGTSIYATLWKDFFTNYVSSDFGTLKIDNGGLVNIIDFGDLCLTINNDTIMFLREVKDILDIHLNSFYK